jgi:hypothetical protein
VKAHADTESEPSTTVKKTKEFRVLDPRAGQNYGLIILFHLFLHIIDLCFFSYYVYSIKIHTTTIPSMASCM